MQTTDDDWRTRWPAVVVDRRTEEAVRLLEKYYGSDNDGAPAYSGSRFEAVAALNSNPHSLGPADFTAVSMLSVNVDKHAAIRILGPDASTITALLKQIPDDCDIVYVDPAMLTGESPGGELWRALRRVPELGPTTTSKLIAAKRPRLYPIWDSYIRQAIGQDTLGYWLLYQRVLVADDRAIWQWLTALRKYVPAEVSTLRILDVLLWLPIDEKRRT